MPSVFDTTRCNLSSIPSVGDFTFIKDCSVPEAPPPIYDCPDLDFEIPNLGPIGPAGVNGIPGFNAPCNNIQIATSAVLAFTKRITKPKLSVNFVPRSVSSSAGTTISSEVCQTNLAMNMDFSLPCPGFYLDMSASLVTLAFDDSSASLDFTRREKNPGSDTCGEVLTFKFAMPKTATWRSGLGVPPIWLGTNGDFYLNLGDGSPLKLGNGDIYRKLNGLWGSPKGNIKGDNGENTTMPCCPMTTYASIVTGVYCQGNKLIVQYQS